MLFHTEENSRFVPASLFPLIHFICTTKPSPRGSFLLLLLSQIIAGAIQNQKLSKTRLVR